MEWDWSDTKAKHQNSEEKHLCNISLTFIDSTVFFCFHFCIGAFCFCVCLPQPRGISRAYGRLFACQSIYVKPSVSLRSKL